MCMYVHAKSFIWDVLCMYMQCNLLSAYFEEDMKSVLLIKDTYVCTYYQGWFLCMRYAQGQSIYYPGVLARYLLSKFHCT